MCPDLSFSGLGFFPVFKNVVERFFATVLVNDGMGPGCCGGGFLMPDPSGQIVDGWIKFFIGRKVVEPVGCGDGVAPSPLVNHLLNGVVFVPSLG